MLAEQVRSGLVESSHDGAVAVVDGTGQLVASYGDIDRPFYIRSSAKPFQALVSQEQGAGLEPLELAIACASHRGFPLHVALIRSMLSRAGLDDTDLGCPPSWPLGAAASRLVARGGADAPQRIWHNCSGKHAGFLRACVARGWPVEGYLDPNHPLQRQVIATIAELGEFHVTSVGVDGCGAPVMRTTTRVMGLLYARLATEERLAAVLTAMHRYPALVAVNGEGDTAIATAVNSAAKGGAVGCIGVALEGRLGVAVKSWDGSGTVANLAAATALDQLGALSETASSELSTVLRPPVLGGGEVVGRMEPRFGLRFS